jgi:hypothetical protein
MAHSGGFAIAVIKFPATSNQPIVEILTALCGAKFSRSIAEKNAKSNQGQRICSAGTRMGGAYLSGNILLMR